MANTYVAIATVTVGSGGAANIEFTSIPATYTDLVIKGSFRRETGGAEQLLISFNNNTSNYSHRVLETNGTSVTSNTGTSRVAGLINAATYTANTFANNEIYIPNYAGSTNKSYSSDSVMENNATANYLYLVAGLWSDTSAITSIKLTDAGAADFEQYSTATLYGIKNS